MPYLTQVAVGCREKTVYFGQDYPTDDGTCEETLFMWLIWQRRMF